MEKEFIVVYNDTTFLSGFVASRLIAEFWIAERKKKIFFLYLFDDADATLNAKFVDVT